MNNQILHSHRTTDMLLAIAQALTERGIDLNALYIRAGISLKVLNDPESIISSSSEIRFIEEALTLVPTLDLAIEAGLNIEFRFNESWALAVITSRDLESAFHVATRHIHLTPFHFGAHIVKQGDEAKIFPDSHLVMNLTGQFLLTINMVAAFRILNYVLNEPFTVIEAAFEFEIPKSTEAFKKIFGENINFKTETSYLKFSSNVLNRSLMMSNPILNSAYHSACESYQRGIIETGRFSALVRIFLLEKPCTYPTASEAAKEFAMSERSFRRKLCAEGISFRTIQNEIKFEISKTLLTQTQLSIIEISARVGYSEVSNFSAAFKKATGKTPAKFKMLANTSK